MSETRSSSNDLPLRDEDQAALRFAAVGDAALCTIVGIEGSFSRRLGAQLAIHRDGRIVGSLADGCLESELARQVQVQPGSQVLRYGRGSPFVDFRLPCGSGIDVLIDPAPDCAALRQTVAQLDRREEAALALPLGPDHAFRLRRYVPAARLVVAGAGPEAERLVALAGAFGAEALQLLPGRDLALGSQPAGVELDPWTAVALLFHDHEWEVPLLEWALASPAFYIGALGGQVTRESRQAALEAQGHSAAEIARIASPMGAIRHARDAGVLALSVLAEVIGRYEQRRLQAWQC